jgi:hypothetical protein
MCLTACHFQDNSLHMSRLNIHVPYDQRQEAKALGARWDAEASTWFIPPGVDRTKFAKWIGAPLPVAPKSTVPKLTILAPGHGFYRADRFALVTGQAPCWKCHQSTKVTAVLVAKYEERDEIDHEEFQPFDEPALFVSIEALDQQSCDTLASKAPWLKAGFSGARQEVYLASHCSHCQALQGAWFLQKPGAIFFPETRADIAGMTVEWVDEPIVLNGGASSSTWLDWLIERR